MKHKIPLHEFQCCCTSYAVLYAEHVKRRKQHCKSIHKAIAGSHDLSINGEIKSFCIEDIPWESDKKHKFKSLELRMKIYLSQDSKKMFLSREANFKQAKRVL